jgi:excisionase family DNA binding protein
MSSKTTTITQASDLPLVLTPMDVADVLKVSRNTAYEVVHRADFPAFKVGKQYRVQRDRFIQWMSRV